MPTTTAVRAVRGAIQVDADDPDLIGAAAAELAATMLADNGLTPDDVISVLFTATPDITSAFPATAARLGPLDGVPVMCAVEIPVPGSLPRIVRAMAHVSTPNPVKHVYLRGARALRPDVVAL